VNVRSIFRPWVVSVDGDDRLADAAGHMQNEQVGSVVVTGHFPMQTGSIRGNAPPPGSVGRAHPW
jgi:predicted transcriptional regulator